MDKHYTAIIINEDLWVTDGKKTREEVHKQVTDLWKEIVKPSDSSLYETSWSLHEAMERVWPGFLHSTWVNSWSDDDIIANLPADGETFIYKVRGNPGNGRNPRPAIEHCTLDGSTGEMEFHFVMSLTDWSEAVCGQVDHPHSTELVDLRLGTWTYLTVHADHLEAMADYAETAGSPLAKSLRKESDRRQEEAAYAAQHMPGKP